MKLFSRRQDADRFINEWTTHSKDRECHEQSVLTGSWTQTQLRVCLLLWSLPSFNGINVMATKAKASIRLKLQSEKQLSTLLAALTPEAEASITRRAAVKLEKDGLFLVLTVDAEDTVALRSTLNAYLRWIGSTVNVISLVEKAWFFRLFNPSLFRITRIDDNLNT